MLEYRRIYNKIGLDIEWHTAKIIGTAKAYKYSFAEYEIRINEKVYTEYNNDFVEAFNRLYVYASLCGKVG